MPIPILEKPEECIICTESLSNVDTPLVCGHFVHLGCVKKQFKPECPICRHKLDIVVTGKRPEPYISVPVEPEELISGLIIDDIPEDYRQRMSMIMQTEEFQALFHNGRHVYRS